MEELAEEDDAAEVVGVVGGERDELVAYGHDAGGGVRARGAADGVVEVCGVLSCGCGLFGSVEKALAELGPGFGDGF